MNSTKNSTWYISYLYDGIGGLEAWVLALGLPLMSCLK